MRDDDEHTIAGICTSRPAVRLKVLYGYAYWGEQEQIRFGCQMIDVVGILVVASEDGGVEQHIQIIFHGELTTLVDAEVNEFEKFHVHEVVACPWPSSVDRAM